MGAVGSYDVAAVRQEGIATIRCIPHPQEARQVVAVYLICTHALCMVVEEGGVRCREISGSLGLDHLFQLLTYPGRLLVGDHHLRRSPEARLEEKGVGQPGDHPLLVVQVRHSKPPEGEGDCSTSPVVGNG